MKKWWILVGVLVLFGGSRLYYALTDDFRMGNVLFNEEVREEWVTDEPTAEVRELLNQPYTYLGKGAQSFAFVSKDGTTVLKLFKTKHAKLSPWLHLVPSIGPLGTYKRDKLATKQARMTSTLSGYKLAYDHLRPESGLLYLHLNPTTTLGPLTVHNKSGASHSLALDHMVFVLQRRANKWRNVMIESLAEGNVEQVLAHIEQIFQLYELEYSRGLYDSDHGVMHNIGFVEQEPLHLDLGKLKQDPRMQDPATSQKDLAQVVARMETYIVHHHPEYADALLSYIHKRMESRS